MYGVGKKEITTRTVIHGVYKYTTLADPESVQTRSVYCECELIRAAWHMHTYTHTQ